MRSLLLVVGAAAALAAGAGVGFAQSGADVAKGKCMTCHDVDKKKVGPSFKDAAAKNKGNKEAVAKLVGAMKEGKGHPKVAATDAELKAAVQHALSTK
jgi:cytochrome c